MLDVMKRELRSYLYTPVGYVFLCVFWLLGAAFFFLYNVLAASADLGALFGNLSYLFMLVVPLLTMRLFSEERRQRTDQLLYCSPTPLGTVVLGKFCAAVCVLAVALLGTGVYPALLSGRATLQWSMVSSHYLGLLLLGGCYIAVGLLMSALTESQVTAAVLTLAVNMLLQLAEMSASSVHVPYLPFLPSLLSLVALGARYERFATGVIKPTDAGYFIAFIVVMLALSTYVLARRRLVRK